EAVPAYRAEQIVENLLKLDISAVGSDRWMKQHENLELLNIQAHHNVQKENEEFVKEAFITFDKMECLVHELLVIETWKARIFPKISDKIASEANMKAYFVLYHEATIANLLELMLFWKESCVAVGDSLLDLVDYCSRKFAVLSAWEEDTTQKTAKEMLEVDDHKRLVENSKELNFTIAMSTLSIFRYLTDHITDLPLSVMTRILNTNDMVGSAVYLVERAPWLQKRANGTFRRFEDGGWKDVAAADMDRLGKVEAQLWFALYNLLIDTECRRKYEYDERKRDVILRLRAYFTPDLVDQLPFLVTLQRHLEELSIMQLPEYPIAGRSGLMVEMVRGSTAR
ncbi:hypothetical protein BDK51DRAFT_18762, partial [Blyttiomyces helicus]